LFLTVLQGAGLVGPLAIAWVSDRLGRRAIVTQITLLLSAVMTVWLAYQTSLGPLFYLNLILYGSVVEARGSLFLWLRRRDASTSFNAARASSTDFSRWRAAR